MKKVLFVLLLLLTGFNGLLLWQNSRQDNSPCGNQCSLQVARKTASLAGPVLQSVLIN